MDNEQELISQIDSLFNAKSITVVGVPRGMKSGKLFLIALLDQGFKGPIYPINPSADEIDGLKAYPTVESIPHPVDLAIILVPSSQTLEVVKQCAAKGVKGAILFTSGYKELGTEEGRAMEKEMVDVAKASGMRLIGPNCMGLYAPGTGLAFFPNLSKIPGPVGLISHSGSLANILGRVGPSKGIYFSKAISLGNECDLSAGDFLTYLASDEQTKVIATYVENIRPGSSYMQRLKNASIKKPVVLWKVGLTDEGGKAAASHTGALRVAKDVWAGMVRQSGGTPVVGFEAWMDAMMGFSMLPDNLGDRMAVLSGPGGLAVGAAEACGNSGLKLAKLSDDTKSKLAKIIAPTGTSLNNPIDVGLSGSMDMNIYIQSARIAAGDENVDAVIVIGGAPSLESNRDFTKAIIEARNEFQTPFIMIGMPGQEPEYAKIFFDAKLPFYESSERAAKNYSDVLNYQRWKRAQI